jgi:isocitrate dehydrogenase
MKQVFDENYRTQFRELGLLKKTNGELCHFLSDVATMHVIRWNDGGWGMCSHNYDGDVLTDEIAQVIDLLLLSSCRLSLLSLSLGSSQSRLPHLCSEWSQ